jgi:peptide chain release factor 1
MLERALFIYVFSGANVRDVFQNEEGVHSWHRVPPTEKKGRVHTSSITVVILDEKHYEDVNLSSNEIKLETTRGTGNGGQHKNSTDSCVVVTHIATGIKVVRDGRNQHKNKEEALKELKRRVNDLYRTGHVGDIVEERRNQIGNSDRSDKRRTYKVKDNLVIDHVTNKSTSLKIYLEVR